MLYQRMLVPLDGSSFAECILKHVTALASGCKIPEITLIYVIEPFNPAIFETSPEFVTQAEEAAASFAREYLAGVVANLKEAGAAAKPVIVEGRAAEAIIDYSTRNGIDLIAMSTHGRSGITRWLLGSVAEKVARGASATIFLAPPAYC